MAGTLSPERRARLILNRVGEPGHDRLLDLVASVGPVPALGYLNEKRGGLAADLALRLAEADPEADQERGAKMGIRFVTPEDDEWPRGLDDLLTTPHLHRRGGVPIGLWVKGPCNLGEVAREAVAIVGSRSATTYGERASFDIAAGAAAAGITVISGAAFGIDFAAHRGALAAGGTTIAVLACGVDRVYPEAHRDLLGSITEAGLLVSEAPLGGSPLPIRFLARNRLIAALGVGTVIVEAAVRSGALNTANWAGGLGRVVMGLPGPVTSASSVGVHELLRGGGATLVTRAEEVVEAISPIGRNLASPRRAPDNLRDHLSTEERQVLEAVPVSRPLATDRIARTAGIRLVRTREALQRLADLDFVRAENGGWRLCGGTSA